MRYHIPSLYEESGTAVFVAIQASTLGITRVQMPIERAFRKGRYANAKGDSELR